MQSPDFWNRPPSAPGWQARLLSPLAAVYAAGTARRVAQPGMRCGVPVICVGNINAGGTGKTPTVIATLERLARAGHNPHVISRGYGGRQKRARQVQPAIDGASDVGDEPLLLAAFAPTWVGAGRAQAAKLAVEAGADLLVMDDGFQNPDLQKDLSIVVVDAQVGFGNGRVLPAGPLRERVEDGLGRADLLIRIGPPLAQSMFRDTWGGRVDVPDIQATLEPLETGMNWNGLRALAFAGIGRPKKFFDTLEGLGVTLVRAQSLDDHQTLGAGLLARLEREAATLNAQLVTTEKDAVRLPAGFRSKVLTLPVRLRIDDDTLLQSALDGLPYSARRSSRAAEKSS